MTTGLLIETVDPTTSDEWSQLLADDGVVSDVFHSPAWLGVMRDTFDLQPQALIVPGRAGVSFCQVEDRLVGAPFSDFCDPLLMADDDWDDLSRGLLETSPLIELQCLRASAPCDDDRFSVSDTAAWHSVALDCPLDEVWDRLHSSARRAIRKAEKSGVEVRPATTESELRAFYDLHLRTRKYKYGLLAQPYLLFENIWQAFIVPEKGALLGAWHHGALIGGVLLLEWGGQLYYKYSASDLDATEYRPNDLLIWKAMDLAVEGGLERLDLGLSHLPQEGLIRYKSKFATDQGTISFLASGERPPSRLRQETLPRLTALLTDPSVPDEVTEKAGEILYHHFV